jgi:hypothetical protein
VRVSRRQRSATTAEPRPCAGSAGPIFVAVPRQTIELGQRLLDTKDATEAYGVTYGVTYGTTPQFGVDLVSHRDTVGRVPAGGATNPQTDPLADPLADPLTDPVSFAGLEVRVRPVAVRA